MWQYLALAKLLIRTDNLSFGCLLMKWMMFETRQSLEYFLKNCYIFSNLYINSLLWGPMTTTREYNCITSCKQPFLIFAIEEDKDHSAVFIAAVIYLFSKAFSSECDQYKQCFHKPNVSAVPTHGPPMTPSWGYLHSTRSVCRPESSVAPSTAGRQTSTHLYSLGAGYCTTDSKLVWREDPVVITNSGLWYLDKWRRGQHSLVS
jgi:hypothetical protein